MADYKKEVYIDFGFSTGNCYSITMCASIKFNQIEY